jgi:hypothetical protein
MPEQTNYRRDSFGALVNLPEGIIINSMSAYDPDTSSYIECYTLDLQFTPPDPSIVLTAIPTSCQTCQWQTNKIKITLKENQDNTTKTIEVNSLGLVDVIN